MVGGYAANLYGYQRFIGVMDIWLKDSLENRQQLRKVFVECNIRDFPMIEYIQFIPDWTDFRLNNGLHLDILIDVKGLEGYTFDECLKIWLPLLILMM